jgi:chorismate synthase
VAFWIENQDRRPVDYGDMASVPRPSHADFTYRTKYGVLASSGGGRASARETVARVAGGAIAEKLLRVRHGVEIVAWVSAVGEIQAADLAGEPIRREDVDRHLARCPDPSAAEAMAALIARVKDEGDSVGGIVTCVCRNVPAGWGEPVFLKIEAVLAAAVLSIPACKGFEVGSGFAGARMRGSVHNDPFVQKGDRLGTRTNFSGGVQGGITNGEPIVFRAAFKPPATIGRAQHTADYSGQDVEFRVTRGRHDPCVLPRAVLVVEGMAALVLADMALLARAQ